MKNHRSTLFALFVAAFAWAGCGGKPAEVSSTPTKSEPANSPAASPASAPRPGSAKAPATFKAAITTTKGEFIVEVNRDWAPNGADRFYDMVKSGFLTDIAFFRVVPGFMAQFGIHGDPAVMGAWRDARIMDDPGAGQSNSRGMLTFAMAGPNSRTTQIFISFGDNHNLDAMGFTPFGRVLSGMEVVDTLYKGYGDGPPYGNGVDQGRFQMEGNAFLKRGFPLLDYIKSARLAD